MSEVNKWIDLSTLPKKQQNGTSNQKEIFDWSNSIGYKVSFQYDDIKSQVEIVQYNKSRVYFKYINNIFNMFSGDFVKCKFGNVLNKYSREFKFIVGLNIKDNKRDLVITNKEYRKNSDKIKYYKYTCNKCGWTEGWIRESDLTQGKGCSCCAGKIVVEGINDIPTLCPEIVKYFQGGYNEAKLYTCHSGKNIYPICPECGKIKKNQMRINTICRYRSIGCECSDNISYSEKFMLDFLNQCDINYTYQLTKRNFKWCKGDGYDVKYDFYIPSLNCIIETHGLQHYKESTRGRTLQEEQVNDIFKEKLAKENGIINYIHIDCRYSELEFIKNSIINSGMFKLFNITKQNINWLKCGEFAIKNLSKEICIYKSQHPMTTTSILCNKYQLSNTEIIRILKKGNQLNWCNYDAKQEIQRSSSKNGLKNSKPVQVLKDNEIIGIFPSAMELERISNNIFGVKLLSSRISNVCTGKRNHHKGFTFKYIDKEEYNKLKGEINE